MFTAESMNYLFIGMAVVTILVIAMMAIGYNYKR